MRGADRDLRDNPEAFETVMTSLPNSSFVLLPFLGVSRVCISTIQRLYSMLRGEEIDPEIDERSGYELRESLWKQPPLVVYNPNVPIETFDFIITDECHRSIYNLWRQVLDYFNAYLIGRTATPSKQTIGFPTAVSMRNSKCEPIFDLAA
jgi:type I site-specific restriction endonuclease